MTAKVVRDDIPEGESPDLTPLRGSMFDFGQGLFLQPDMNRNPTEGAVYDYSDYQARDVTAMLRRDHRGRAIDNVLRMPAMSAKWSIVAGKGDSGEAADALERLTRPATSGGSLTPLQLVVNQMTTARAYRKSFHEIWWGLDDDGTTMVRDVAFRPASTCRRRANLLTGRHAGFEQTLLVNMAVYGQKRPGGDGKPIVVAADRAVVYVHGQDRDPVGGISDLEIPFWCFKTKQKLLYLWMCYCEGVALPRTVVKSQEGEEKAREQGRKIAKAKSSGVVAVDHQTELDVLDLSGKGGGEFKEAITYLDAAAANAHLAGFVDLPSQATSGSGSRALFNGASDFFLQAEQAFMTELAGEVTAQLVAPLTAYNHGARAASPRFEFAPLSEQDLQPVMTLLVAMLSSTDPAAPKPPVALMDELVMRGASILDLDTDRIKKDLVEGAERAKATAAAMGQVGTNAQAVAGTAGMVSAAVRHTQQAGLAPQPPQA